ncbi:MAG: paraquat-inducible protein A [Pseudomonadota bacterium]
MSTKPSPPTVPTAPKGDLAELIACPQCDLLHHVGHVSEDASARCQRCGTVLFAPRTGAIERLVALALGALVLMVVAVSFPFLQMSASGFSSKASVFDTISAFTGGLMAPLSLATAAFIILLPVLRLCALIYAVGPLLFGRPPLSGASASFRLASRLKPWSMAEIFMIGVAVALVKMVGMASIGFGTAFWAFGFLVILVTAMDAMMCERTIWRLLAKR